MESPEENDMIPRHPELWDEPDQIRKIMVRTMRHIYCQGLTTTSGGNISVLDSLGNIWITPSGTDKGSLKPGEVVCVSPDGNFDGPHKPSMEYPLHRQIYNARPGLRALIHAHPPMVTSFSIIHRTPDTSLLRVWSEIAGTVGYAEYATPGSDKVGENVAAEFRKGHDAVIMENHAMVTGGKDLSEALARLESIEYCARTIHAAGSIGEVLADEVANGCLDPKREINLANPANEPAAGERDAFPFTVETDDLPEPGEELLAEEIRMMAVRGCSRGLMYGFSGTISARGGGDRFLITRERVLRCNFRMGDIIKVSNGIHPWSGSTGTGLHTWLHTEIYRRFPSVRAVIMAQPPYLMAFAVTGRDIDVRTIPESWLLLNHIPSLPCETLQPGREEIFDRLSGGAPAVLIWNDSVLVTGNNLLEAFDRLEVAEMTAMSIILAKPLGKVFPIEEEKIRDLERKFLKK